jgi:hypothetical protein
MATNLKLAFDADGDKKVILTFPYATATADAEDIKSLMEEIIDNGEIYVDPPLIAVGAEFVVRTVTPIDLD